MNNLQQNNRMNLNCSESFSSYHFVKHPIQQGIQSFEYRVEVDEFRCRLIQACEVDANGKSSGKNRQKYKLV